MRLLPFADSFQVGAVLTIVLPLGLLIAIAVWYLIAVRRVPPDTPVSSPAMPADEVIDAAGPSAVAEITPADPPADQP